MAALTQARPGQTRSTGYMTLPVKGATTIFAGGLTCLDATGYAVPGTVSATLACIGIAEDTVVNAGADGAKTVVVAVSAGQRDFLLLNDGTNPCTVAHVGRSVYVQDDSSVGSLATSRSIAGTCMGVSSAGVYVRFGA